MCFIFSNSHITCYKFSASFIFVNKHHKKIARIENLMSSTESIWYREKKKSMKHLRNIKYNFLLKQIERKKRRDEIFDERGHFWTLRANRCKFFFIWVNWTLLLVQCVDRRLNEIRPYINADKSIVEFRMYGQSVDIKFPIIFAKLLYSNRMIRQKKGKQK